MSDTAFSNLLAWIVQVGVLTLVAAAVTRIAHIDAPVVRYAWWRTVLVVCLALPVVQPWYPRELLTTELLALDGRSPAPSAETDDTVNGSAESSTVGPAIAPRWPEILATVLVTGGLVRLIWLGAGLIRLQRLRRTGTRTNTSDAPELFEALAAEGAEVRYVPVLTQPVTFGILRPVVLLPDALRTMSPGVQGAVLAHELWHVRRRDWLWSLSEESLRAVLWFHPAIWYLVSQVQAAREEVVDELSILSTNARRSYLEALLAFADEPAVYPAAPFIRRRQLFNRMLLISKEARMSSRRVVASGAGMAGVLVMTGWYSALAFPLTATAPVEPLDQRNSQSQVQPRDPRAGAIQPATSREQELRAATIADPSNVTNWLEMAKLQEQRGAIDDAEGTFRSVLAATSGTREVLVSMAAFFTRTGQFDKAVGALEDAAARNPGDPAGHQLVAVYYWEKAQKDLSLNPAEKLMYLDSGIAATDRALAQRSDYVEALTYKNILLRMKANLETDAGRQQQLIAEADALRTRAMELTKQRAGAGTVPVRAVSSGSSAASPPPPPPPPPPPSQYYQVDGQQAVRIGGQVPVPLKLRDVRPVYPLEAISAGVAGVVILEAVIDTQGAVRSARVLRSIPILDQAAIDAVQQWRFAPTVMDGVAMPVLMTVTVNFVKQ